MRGTCDDGGVLEWGSSDPLDRCMGACMAGWRGCRRIGGGGLMRLIPVINGDTIFGRK